jgi:site-specific recombinase XerD
MGRSPETATGYSQATMDVRHYRMHTFYRWVWDRRGYTTTVTHDDGDAYMREIAMSEYKNSTQAHIHKAVASVFKWRKHVFDEDPWDPELSFSYSGTTSSDGDYLTAEERRQIRNAALSYGSIPHYNSCSPEERDRYKGLLASRYDIPKEDIGPDHWERANGWKIPSLATVSLETGLRPIEVNRATVDWVNLDANALRIPDTASQKGGESWVSVISDRTASFLEQWLEQRDAMPMYDETDTLWLTTKANPYNSRSLSYLMDNLCDEAGIDTENRDVTWYSIRRGLATALIDEADLSTAREQLRHNNLETTARYDQAPPERRRDALDRLS